MLAQADVGVHGWEEDELQQLKVDPVRLDVVVLADGHGANVVLLPQLLGVGKT